MSLLIPIGIVTLDRFGAKLLAIAFVGLVIVGR
jgi:hypothetical protein